jgi:hypothetical protein
MNSNFDNFWYSIQHPLGPSRELGSYANHQESVEQLIREMNARVVPIKSGAGTSPAGQPIRSRPLVIFRDTRRRPSSCLGGGPSGSSSKSGP